MIKSSSEIVRGTVVESFCSGKFFIIDSFIAEVVVHKCTGREPPRVSRMLQSLVCRGLHRAVGQEPHSEHPGAVGGAADCQEPHGGLPGAVGRSADGQEPHAGLHGAVGGSADGK